MDLKKFWAKSNSWLRTHSLSGAGSYRPEVNDEGLITKNCRRVLINLSNN
jgi:hypothetical protein